MAWTCDRRWLILAALLGGAGQRDAIGEELRFARSFLCADCNNDIEAEGVNRAGRRSMLADGALQRAEAALLDQPSLARALAEVRLARQALESLDEGLALTRIRAALGALR